MWKSIKNCFVVNAFVSTIGICKNYLYNFNFYLYSFFEITSTIFMVDYMNNIKKPSILPIKKQTHSLSFSDDYCENISGKMVETTDERTDERTDEIMEKMERIGEIVGITTIKCLTHSLVVSNIIPNIIPQITTDMSPIIYGILFIGESFMFEIIFDLVHYSAHRYLHESPSLYKAFHKTHHKYKNPSAWTTFHIHPVDLLLSYSVPLVVSCVIMRPSQATFFIYTTYLTHQEIGGHLGKHMYPISSFMQFVWLPRFFNIQLYTEDHDLHHKLLQCNYGKRFAIFDKMFSTYKSGIEYYK